MDEILALRYHIEKVLHHMGGISNWATKLRSLRNGVDARMIPIEHDCSKDGVTVACLLLRISRVPCLHKRIMDELVFDGCMFHTQLL